MAFLGNFIKTLSGALYPRWGGAGWSPQQTYFLAPGARYDYVREAGDIWANSMVALAIKWLGDRFPRPRMQVSRILADGTFKPIANHDLVKLWQWPNEFYSRRALEKAIGLSLICDGNAYIQKVRDGAGRLAELWWLPHFNVFPVWEGNDFISGYRIYIDGAVDQILAREDIIHIRDGIDPRNVRLGFSAVKAQIREICTINEESGYTASLMRNAGVVGLVVAPRDGDFARMVKKEDADLIKDKIRELSNHEQRGSALVLQGPYEIKNAGFSPEQLRLKDLPQQAISRIAASIGVAPMSMGLPDPGKTYSNLADANRMSWGSIKAVLELVGESIRYDLLPEFGLDPDLATIEYDYSEIDELQEPEDKVHTRIRDDFLCNLVKRAKAQELLGYPIDLVADVYFWELQRDLSAGDMTGTTVPGSTNIQPPLFARTGKSLGGDGHDIGNGHGGY